MEYIIPCLVFFGLFLACSVGDFYRLKILKEATERLRELEELEADGK